MNDVYTLFSVVKHTLASHFTTQEAQKRLANVHCSLVDPRTMATQLYGDNYRRSLRIPGYYDPNSHTIFLNRETLPSTVPQTASIICYHELVHSVCAHRVIKTDEYQAFQSGIKIEVFSKKGYRCHHRALNEGMVQYLTSRYNRVPSGNYAYAQEVKLVKIMARDLGHDTIHDTLILGNWQSFKDKFDTQYGSGSFERISRLMDRKHYTAALALLIK